jgi:hypothetical protein
MEPEENIEERADVDPSTEVLAAEEETSPRDARSLVAQMVEAGEWPEPALMEQIVAAGDEAVEPLLGILRTNPHGRPDEAPLDHAIGLLSMIRPSEALPALVDVMRRYKNDTGESASEAITRFGEEGFNTLLELILDPTIVGYQRSQLITSARSAAWNDPVRTARLTEVLRHLFGELAAAAREQRKRQVEPGFHDFYGRDHPDEDVAMNALPPTEELSFLISDLCDLADPLARDMIQAAFEEGLVETWIVDADGFRKDYESGGRPSRELPDWLDDYRDRHADELEQARRLAEMRPVEFPSRSSYPSFSPVESEPWPPPAATAGPIRNAAPKIGRNDPCWCGSGKKYKKCHLGKDAPS